jgi:type I restriction enzyme S subunit
MKLVSLGTVAEVIAGQSPEGIYFNTNGEGIPFYQGKKEFGDRFLGAPTTWTTKITKLAQHGDILMSVRAPVGPINFSTQEICIGRGLASIRVGKLVDKNFLFYFLLHKQPEISGNTGAVFDSINKDQIASIRIPLPSLEKQREIVKKLDSAFAEIELLEDNLMKLISLNETLLSTKINSELGAVRGSSGVKTLGDFGKISYGYTAKSSSSHIGPKYLRITDIQNKSVNWSEVPSCEISSEEKSKFLLSKGDIVFARTGATTGKSYLIDADVDAVFASYLIRIKPDPKELDSEFLYYFFQSAYYWDEIAEGISGSAQGGFNASKLQAMKVSFPTNLTIQGDIVKKIREFEFELNLRMSKLLDEVEIAKRLRQSLLSSAFTQEEAIA